MRPYENPKPKVRVIYGWVAVQKLIQIAGFDERLGGASRRILMIIAGYSDQRGFCFPSITMIARNLGMSRQAVTKQINNLVRYGYLVREANYTTNGRRVSNIYYLNLDMAIEYREKPTVFSKGNGTSKVPFLSLPEDPETGTPEVA
jgi:DNA-binding MarR family transcriptional regulator